MGDAQEVTDLDQMLERIGEVAEENDHASLEAVLEVVGRRSFGPWLILAGLGVLAPVIGDIPGVPTTIGIIVILSGVQLVFGRGHVWLPKWLLKRSVKSAKLKKVLGKLQKPARFVDRLLRPRLRVLVTGPAIHVIGVLGILLGACMWAMELVPFSANLGGAALLAFGLALIAEDGLFGLIAFTATAGGLGFIAYALLF